MASVPDLTAQLNSTITSLGNATALLNKIAACNAAKQFYNPSTGACYAAGTTSFTHTIFTGQKEKTISVGSWDICALTEQWEETAIGPAAN